MELLRLATRITRWTMVLDAGEWQLISWKDLLLAEQLPNWHKNHQQYGPRRHRENFPTFMAAGSLGPPKMSVLVKMALAGWRF